MSSDINVQTFSGKVNITSNLLVGSSHLFVDTINNRVGLVTNTPDAGLHVNSNAYVHTDFRVGSGIVMNDTNGRITAGSFVGDGSAMTGINSDSGLWSGAGTSTVYLSTSTDKVGIGKTPSEKLDVEGIIRVNRNGGSLQLVGTDHTYIEYYPDGVSSGRKAYVGYAGGSDNSFTISNSAGNGHVILGGGSVGIGVSDPDSKLEVRGNIRASFSDTDHGMFIDAGGTILRNYGGNGAGLHFTSNAIWPTNYLGSYSAGGIDLGSSTYRWNNVYTEALNASGTIDSTGIITCNANKMVITGSSPTLYLRDSNARTGMIHQNDNRMYFLSGVANSDSWTQTANSRWPLYLQMDTNEAVFGGNIDAAVGTVTASTFSTTSQLYLGTSASIRQTSTPGWTGNPGSGIGKIEYHSNRWYIVAGSNSSELLRVRRNESDKFVIDNNGSISLGTVPAARISGTVGTATNQSGGTVSCTSGSFSGQFSASTASSRDKFRVYPASSYCIGMQSGVTFGDLNDWAMTFQMNNDNDRGFWWGDDGHGVNQGAMALSTRGWLNVAERIKVGGGQTDTGAAGWNLQVQGNAYISSSLECDGRIYADNGCHVRGDWLRVNGTNGLYFESYGGGWFMNDSTWVQTYNSKGLYVNNQIRMASLRALGGTFASRLDWPNSGHHVDCYHNLSGHVFHINYYAQQSVYLNRTAYSDRRIKEDIKDIDDVSALNILRKIKPKTYKYKLQPHKGTVYGFIAQDVREVLPYATNLTKLSAPFDREKFVNATILENGVVNLDKPCNELEIGKNAYFYYESSTSTRDFEVTEITSPTQFRVRIDEGGTEWIGNTILVGKEVDDFHGIDKDAIFTVATAALQEVDRQLQAEKVKTHQMEEDLQAEKARTYELQKKVELLEMSHTSLIQRIEALENL